MTFKAAETFPRHYGESLTDWTLRFLSESPSLLHNFPAEPVSAETGRDSRNAGTTLLDTAIPCLQIVRSDRG